MTLPKKEQLERLEKEGFKITAYSIHKGNDLNEAMLTALIDYRKGQSKYCIRF